MKLNSTAVVVGIALALFLGPRPATAWTSGPEETPGPQEARNVWSWAKSTPANEHADLLKRAFEHAGLPLPLFPSPSEPFKARVFTEGGTTNGGLPSFIPAPLSNAKAIATRSYTLPGFAALPDHSYALWDWASGNERCPIDTVAGTDLDGKDPAVACHTFKSHMGILNSTHFPPQSSKTYAWYHTLALKRAKECKTLNDNFVAAPLNYADPDQRQRIDAMVKECEREALVIEAVGQHFLQDTWAMGHMWERWGTPFLSGFVNIDAGSSSISEERRARGELVAYVAGLVHGADSVLHEKGIESRDQMSYGRSPDITWRQLTGVGFSGQGIGDIYADVLLSDPDYVTQRDKLLRCSAAGVSDVYRQTAMVSGGSTGSFVINPVGPECYSQRATNLAIWEGFGLNVVLRDPYLGIGVPVRLGLTNPIVTSLITGWGTAVELRGSTAKSALLAELRTDMTRLGAFVELRKKAAPTDVDLANLGLSPDGFFMLTGRNGLLTQTQDPPPAPYADPGREANPSHLQDPDTHARYIARVFNKAHVADWCIDDEADPDALQARVVSATPDETTAAYEACVEFTERHVRLGSMPSICEAATASSLPYSFGDTTGATNVKTAAMEFCGCDKAAKSMTAVNDRASTKLNTPVKIDVKANDTAPDGLPLNQLVFSALRVVDPLKGSVKENPDGTITFTPAANVTGDVVIEYALKSPCGAISNTAKLTVTIASGDKHWAGSYSIQAGNCTSLPVNAGQWFWQSPCNAYLPVPGYGGAFYFDDSSPELILEAKGYNTDNDIRSIVNVGWTSSANSFAFSIPTAYVLETLLAPNYTPRTIAETGTLSYVFTVTSRTTSLIAGTFTATARSGYFESANSYLTWTALPTRANGTWQARLVNAPKPNTRMNGYDFCARYQSSGNRQMPVPGAGTNPDTLPGWVGSWKAGGCQFE